MGKVLLRLVGEGGLEARKEKNGCVGGLHAGGFD